MAIRQVLINLDTYYHNVIGNRVLLNNLSLFDTNHSNMLHKTMVNEFEGDNFNILPRCSCGKYVGEFYKGHRCEYCQTEVADVSYDPVIWARSIGGMKFINPVYYYQLNALLGSDIQFLTGLTDNTRTKDNISGLIARNVLKGERTYRNFLNNIRNILVYLTSVSQYKQFPKSKRLRELLEMWDTQEEAILSDYIPLINNVLFNITKTSKGKFMDTGFSIIYDIAISWLRVTNKTTSNEAEIDKVIAKTVNSLGLMPEFYIKNYLSKKSGAFRKHVYGARSPFSFRTVIVSRSGKHKWNELIVPWVTIVSVFRPHILNRLCSQYNFNYRDASDKIFAAAKQYDPLIDEIATQLIKETPNGKGIPTIAQRNPSLFQGSAQLCYITGFYKDPTLNVTAFSQGICKFPNADYDGDELNFTVLLDNHMAEIFQVLSPYYNIMGNKPGMISRFLTLLGPMNSVLFEYLKADHEYPERDTLISELVS